MVVNRREREVQGIEAVRDISGLEQVDLAILAIPATQCLEAVKELAYQKGTKAFIIISAGFGELTEKGVRMEQDIVDVVNEVGGNLIGPNCIGIINQHYQGVFTTPVPVVKSTGVDLISSSGATAVFIMEAGIPRGLTFNSVFSVGNSAQIGVEEVLEYLDVHFNPETDALVKLLYIEEIREPVKFYKHASSLIRKGCRIAAIKSGGSEAGGRAASSHTGALASPDVVIRALFRKIGILYCSSRNELITVGSIYSYKELKGKNIAVITHAGGSAVMLSDALSNGGLEVPEIKGPEVQDLLDYLHEGSSVSNPIDFLATGTADQLGIIIDYCEHKFDQIDAIVVVFGSPGLFDVSNVYKVLNVKMDVCRKPIYPVLPSIMNAQKEIDYFLSKGRINFPDEVELGVALARIYNSPKLETNFNTLKTEVDTEAIARVLSEAETGYLLPSQVAQLLEAVGIPQASESTVRRPEECAMAAEKIGYPLAMKVVGPVHKTEVKGVALNVYSSQRLHDEFNRLMNIEGAEGVLVQQMLKGHELFIGAKKVENYGPLIMCGLGGIFIEALKDVSSAFAPVSQGEALQMIGRLIGKSLFDGIRGQKAIDKMMFAELVQRVSLLVSKVPQIVELDLNPLIATDEQGIITVDARIRIEQD